MLTRGYAKHPCAQGIYSRGVAVRPIRAYRRVSISSDVLALGDFIFADVKGFIKP